MRKMGQASGTKKPTKHFATAAQGKNADLAKAAQPYASRAAAVAAIPGLPADLDRIEYFSGSGAGNVVPIGLVRRAGATVIPDMPGWVPAGLDIPMNLFGSNPLKAKEWADSLPTKRSIVIDGSITLTEPLEYDDSRNDTVRGATNGSNLKDGGSIIEYSGMGNAATITSATNGDPAVFTAANHGFANGRKVFVAEGEGNTWPPALNGGPWSIADRTTNTFTLKDIAGNYLSGVGLGTLTGAVVHDVPAMAALKLTGSFCQSFHGLTIRAANELESLLWIGANDKKDRSGGNLPGDNFSGSITVLEGLQLRPEAGVRQAAVVIENHKFVHIRGCWFEKSPNNAPGLLLGGKRTNNRRTLLEGTVYNTLITSVFFFADVALQNVIGLNLMASQFDGDTRPVRLFTVDGGVAAGIDLSALIFNNAGLSAAPGQAAIDQGYFDQSTNSLLPFTAGWLLNAITFVDWPVAIKIGAGMMRINAGIFRGRKPDNVGIVIEEHARQVMIDPTCDFSQMIRAGNVGIEDRRYKSIEITSASKTNPVVIGLPAGHHVRDGERPRITGVLGMTELNNKEYLLQNVTADTAELYTTGDAVLIDGGSIPVDGTGFGTYTSGGLLTKPYMWHRENIGGQYLSVPHSDLIFDLALDQSATLPPNSTALLLNMFNVPIIGGDYEINYDTVVAMNGGYGTVKFDVSIAGLIVAQKSFTEPEATMREVPLSFNRTIPLAAIPGNAGNGTGSLIRFRIHTPESGNIIVRGKSASTLGGTFMQIRKR